MKHLTVKVLILIALYGGLVLIESCLFCNCPKQKLFHYSVTDLVLNTNQYNWSDSAIHQLPAKDSVIPGDQLVLNLNFLIHSYAKSCAPKQPLLISSAWACKCNELMLSPSDAITHISIVTLGDYDAVHPSGTEVGDLFSVFNAYKNGKPFLEPIENAQFSYVFEGMNHTSITLYGTQRPTMKGSYQFAVAVTLNNQTTYRDTTDVLRLE